jgi:hypothetical protein
MKTLCWTSCFTAWKYLQNTLPSIVIVLGNNGVFDSRAGEFPFKTESSLENLHAVTVIFDPREDEIDLTDNILWQDWNLGEGKRYKAFVAAAHGVKVPRELMNLPPPQRSCFPCPYGFFMRPLSRFAMAEDRHQFFSQMEKKKKFLEAICKAIYDDKLWEDKAALYVSWLELESFDEVDFIGHCKECPVGTSFKDLQVIDWNSADPISVSMKEAMSKDNTPLIKHGKNGIYHAFPVEKDITGQLHAKLVAIQTEARPAVQSTQPAYALHTICAIHTVSCFHGASTDEIAMARNVCLDLVFEASRHDACSHSDLGCCTDSAAEALSARQTTSICCWHKPVQLSGLPRVFVHALAFSSTPSHANAAEFSSTPSQCHCSCTRSVCSTQPTASHHSSRVCNCLTVAALQHGMAALHRAFMGIKQRPVERPVEHA